jgi:hypothetical protein
MATLLTDVTIQPKSSYYTENHVFSTNINGQHFTYVIKGLEPYENSFYLSSI